MKKVLFVFSAVAIAALTACGPSAEELAEKEKMRADSIAAAQAMEQAKMDSIAAAEAMEQARMDSIAAAEAMAAEAMANAPKGGSKPKAPAAPKEEPKPAREGVNQGGSSTPSSREGTNNSGDNKSGTAKPDPSKRGGLNNSPK